MTSHAVYDADFDPAASSSIRFCSVPVRIDVLRRDQADYRGLRMIGPRSWQPRLPVGSLRRVLGLLEKRSGVALRDALRAAAVALGTAGDAALAEQACLLVLADLANLGWRFRVVRGIVYMVPKSLDEIEPRQAKEMLRQSLLEARAEQLAQPGTRAFFARVHEHVDDAGTPRIDQLIDDGASLAAALREHRGGDLRQVIDPYLQYVDATHDCAQTHMNLMEIWRYFRHTWSLEYRPTPGRSFNFLIRNGARPGHPVMGIIGLANAVFQLSCRDHSVRSSSPLLTASAEFSSRCDGRKFDALPQAQARRESA